MEKPIAKNLFRVGEGAPTLIGSQCQSCGEHFFPIQSGCGNCSSDKMKTVELGRAGTLWSWTTQRFMPKSPYDRGEASEEFSPFGVGYVEMESGLKVEARLTESSPGKLKIGMPMELVIEKFRTDRDGVDVMNFAFAPKEIDGS